MNPFLRILILPMLLLTSVMIQISSCVAADLSILNLVYTGETLGQIEPVKY